jgi:hypothetical protein
MMMIKYREDILRHFWTGNDQCGLLKKLNEFVPPSMLNSDDRPRTSKILPFKPGFGWFDSLLDSIGVSDFDIGVFNERINETPQDYFERISGADLADFERKRLEVVEWSDTVLPELLHGGLPNVDVPDGNNQPLAQEPGKDLGSLLPILMLLMFMK